MNEMVALKRCPFCGGEAHLKRDAATIYEGQIRITWGIRCKKCGLEQRRTATYCITDDEFLVCQNNGKQDLISYWNRRTTT